MHRPLLTILCVLMLTLSPTVARTATLSPSVVELEASRGEVVESSFEIFNTGMTPQQYFLGRLAFEPSGEDGTPVFTPWDSRQEGLLSWLDLPVVEFTVPPRSKVGVPFRVVVPDDIPAGSFYGALTVSTAPTEVVAANGALIEAKTAVLVFLTVEGETTQQLALLDFALEQDDASRPYGLFSYRVQNQGNVHLVPRGRIELRGMFGQTIQSWDANPTDGRVLPGSTRTYTVDAPEDDDSWLGRAGYQLRHFAFGPASAHLTIAYGDHLELEAAQELWLIPWELAGTLAVLTALCSIPFLRRRKVTS